MTCAIEHRARRVTVVAIAAAIALCLSGCSASAGAVVPSGAATVRATAKPIAAVEPPATCAPSRAPLGSIKRVTLPNTTMKVTTKVGDCFDLVESWKTTGVLKEYDIAVKRAICDRLGFDVPLNQILGHGLFTARATFGGLSEDDQGDASCQWTLPYSKYDFPDSKQDYYLQGLAAIMTTSSTDPRYTFNYLERAYIDQLRGGTMSPAFNENGVEGFFYETGPSKGGLDNPEHTTMLIATNNAGAAVLLTSEFPDTYKSKRDAINKLLKPIAFKMLSLAPQIPQNGLAAR